MALINIDLNDSKAKIKVLLVGYIAVQPCPTVQRDTKQNTEQYNVASKCRNMQLGNITDSETHLVDNMLYPVVNARTEPGCPDRSRYFPGPIVPTPHSPHCFHFHSRACGNCRSPIITSNITFLIQNQLSHNTESQSSLICNNVKIMYCVTENTKHQQCVLANQSNKSSLVPALPITMMVKSSFRSKNRKSLIY